MPNAVKRPSDQLVSGESMFDVPQILPHHIISGEMYATIKCCAAVRSHP